MNKNLEIIRAACIKANPDIMKLETGCLFLGLDKKTVFEVPINGFPSQGNEILGRPIRLADVMNALRNAHTGKQVGNYFLDVKGDFWKIVTENADGDWHMDNIGPSWNLLKDDLVDNPQTWDFLATLLK